MYLIKSILLYTSLLTSNYEISFVRFYANESDYISDIRLLATQRFAQSHMQVFYNDQKIPQIKEWLDDNLPYLIERLVKKEIDHMVNKAERLDL